MRRNKNKKEQRRAAKGNKRQMETRTKYQNEKQKATKSIFHSHFHSFAPILDLWKVVDIKSNKKPVRATTGNESSKKLRRATKSNKGHRSWKHQNGQEKTKTSNERHKSPDGNQALSLPKCYDLVAEAYGLIYPRPKGENFSFVV